MTRGQAPQQGNAHAPRVSEGRAESTRGQLRQNACSYSTVQMRAGQRERDMETRTTSGKAEQLCRLSQQDVGGSRGIGWQAGRPPDRAPTKQSPQAPGKAQGTNSTLYGKGSLEGTFPYLSISELRGLAESMATSTAPPGSTCQEGPDRSSHCTATSTRTP